MRAFEQKLNSAIGALADNKKLSGRAKPKMGVHSSPMQRLGLSRGKLNFLNQQIFGGLLSNQTKR